MLRGSTWSHRPPATPTSARARLQLEESAGFDRQTSTTSSAPRPPACTRSAASARSAAAAFRRPGVSGRLVVALSARGLSREMLIQDRAGHALCQEAHRAGHADHRGRHELRCALGERQGGARAGGHRTGHLDHHRRWRHDPEERAVVQDARVSVPAVALRLQPDDVRKADAIEMVIGQGAKPGGGGMLLGQKVSARVAPCAPCPKASISARPAAIRTGPARTTWRSRSRSCARSPIGNTPIYVKVGATRVFHDVKLAVHAGADVVVVDGMQGGTAATQWAFIEHVGIPTLAAVRQAVDALEDLNMKEAGAADRLGRHSHRRGCGQGAGAGRGCRVDRAGCAGRAGLQLGQLRPARQAHPGPATTTNSAPRRAFAIIARPARCPVGVTTQDPVLEQRLEPAVGAKRVRNYLQT
jgi:hypothetical protein